MTRVTCARLFEAEAMRDGRLAGDELASFARHATGCTACRREVQALEALADGLRVGAAGAPPADELHRLRERTRLIAAFDASLVAPRRRAPAWRWAVGTAAAAIVVAAAAVPFLRGPAGVETDPVPGVVVQAGAAAVWTKHSEGSNDSIVLYRGELWIRVDHSRQRGKLVVGLPDGELEDRGTTFIVSAADGRTTRVAVQEGSVVLRIAGRPATTIGGGETWLADPRPAAVTTAAVSAPAEPKQRESIRSPPKVTPVHRAAATRVIQTSDRPDAAMDFRAAVALLHAGAIREAAAAFAHFMVEHPRDRRAEDAAYLLVIALQRCGAPEERRRAAQAYLQRFPWGFRRTEVEPLSR